MIWVAYKTSPHDDSVLYVCDSCFYAFGGTHIMIWTTDLADAERFATEEAALKALAKDASTAWYRQHVRCVDPEELALADLAGVG